MRRSSGFSLIEILLVLSLLGLISAVCVVNFDAIRTAFSGESVSPVNVLEKAILQGRLKTNQLHKKLDIFITEEAIILKDTSGDEVKKFPLKLSENEHFEVRLLAGKLNADGILEPSDKKLKKIELDEMGFIQSVFIEFNFDGEKERYEVDVLTGDLKLLQS